MGATSPRQVYLDNLEVDFFFAVQTLVWKFCARKSGKRLTENHIINVKNEEKNCKRG